MLIGVASLSLPKLNQAATVSGLSLSVISVGAGIPIKANSYKPKPDGNWLYRESFPA